MGGFYNSICVPGRSASEVRRAIERWLAARGFRTSAEPNLFDLDAASERSVFLLWNERWTLVLYSHFEEERRLIRELQNDMAPLAYLWVWDGDVWGLDLFDERSMAASYSSDPRAHQSFADDDPPQDERPELDEEVLERLLGLSPEAARAVVRVRRSATRTERACSEVASLLGVGPAVSSYDDLEVGSAPSSDDGWRLEHHVYFHYDVARESLEDVVDIHSLSIEGAPRDRRILGKSTEQIKLSPELFDELEKLRRRVRWTLAILGPISSVARAWRGVRRATASLVSGGRGGSTEPPVQSPSDSPVETVPTATATRLEARNPRHGVRLLLPEGVEAIDVSGRPSAVFAFRIGSLRVTCSARRLRYLREVLRRPSRAEVVRDEKIFAGRLPVRRVVFRLPQPAADGSPSYLAHDVVQTFRGLYVFFYRWSGPLDEETRRLMTTVVESFRLDEDGPPRRGPSLLDAT